MPKESEGQRGTVERVMHEYKEGELRGGRGKGPKVKDRKQAIAIALQESGATNRQSPAKNKRSLSRTKSKERRGETAEAETEGKRAQDRTVAKGAANAESKAALYARAKARGIAGRAGMSKDELARALSH